MESKAPRFVLAYDARCGPCSRFKAIVSFLDARKRMEFVPLESAERSGLLARVAPSSVYSSFHLIGPAQGAAEKNVMSGAQGVLPLMRLLSPSGAVSRLMEAAPGSAAAASFAYFGLSRLHRGCSTVARPDLPGAGRSASRGA